MKLLKKKKNCRKNKDVLLKVIEGLKRYQGNLEREHQQEKEVDRRTTMIKKVNIVCKL
jgi:hypothetical protein